MYEGKVNSKLTKLEFSDGNVAEAELPVIVSASRRCDIPAFGAHKFLDDLKTGYTLVRNPYNGKRSVISFSETRLFVFWSKNPRPFFHVLEWLNRCQTNYYFQFTLNDYEREGFEKGLPPLGARVETFKSLSKTIGKEKIIWRFDPLILTPQLSPELLIDRIDALAHELSDYTEQLVFSFVDIAEYVKISRSLFRGGFQFIDFDQGLMAEMASAIAAIGKQYQLCVSTCCEAIDLSGMDISHNRCIDDRLIARLFPDDNSLTDYVGRGELLFGGNSNYRKIKDKSQRKNCGCIKAKDIGHYRECGFGCVYCYAK